MDNPSLIVFLTIIFSPLVFMLFLALCCTRIKKKCRQYNENKASKKLMKILNKNYKFMINELDIDCSICLNEIDIEDTVLKLECEHIYHNTCLKDWYLKSENKNCPICREDIDV